MFLERRKMRDDRRWEMVDSGFRIQRNERRETRDSGWDGERRGIWGYGEIFYFWFRMFDLVGLMNDRKWEIFNGWWEIWEGWWETKDGMGRDERDSWWEMRDLRFEMRDEKRETRNERREMRDERRETMGCGESFDDGIRREFWWWDAERVETMFDDGIQMFDERLSMMGCGEMRKLRR